MMPALIGVDFAESIPQMYSNGLVYDEYARQLVSEEAARRISRSTINYGHVNSMRISKPNSANNSPQTMMARRRTLMNDSNLARRRRHALDQALLQIQETASPYGACRESSRPSRPLSWHPGSYIQQPQIQIPQQLPQYDFPQYALPTPLVLRSRRVFGLSEVSAYAYRILGTNFTTAQLFPIKPTVYSSATVRNTSVCLCQCLGRLDAMSARAVRRIHEFRQY
jgi:hypothetical protein